MKLVDDWRKAWKWFSVWAMALSSACLATWPLVPDDLRQYLVGSTSPEWIALAVAAVLTLGIFGRLVDQGQS